MVWKDIDWKDIGQRIREKRKEKGMRQEDLAELAEVSTSYIGMIERGEKFPSLETFIILANALDASADELLSGVLKNGHKIRLSQYAERLEQFNREKRKVIYNVIDVLIDGI